MLSYWLESYNSVAQTGRLWVKVPSIPGGIKNIYLYYGNATATSQSSAANTFTFGADFEDGTVGGLSVTTAGSGSVNVPLAPSQYMYGLKVDGWAKQPDPVLPKRPGKWDDYGTREIAPVISETDGRVVVDQMARSLRTIWVGTRQMACTWRLVSQRAQMADIPGVKDWTTLSLAPGGAGLLVSVERATAFSA